MRSWRCAGCHSFAPRHDRQYLSSPAPSQASQVLSHTFFAPCPKTWPGNVSCQHGNSSCDTHGIWRLSRSGQPLSRWEYEQKKGGMQEYRQPLEKKERLTVGNAVQLVEAVAEIRGGSCFNCSVALFDAWQRSLVSTHAIASTWRQSVYAPADRVR